MKYVMFLIIAIMVAVSPAMASHHAAWIGPIGEDPIILASLEPVPELTKGRMPTDFEIRNPPNMVAVTIDTKIFLQGDVQGLPFDMKIENYSIYDQFKVPQHELLQMIGHAYFHFVKEGVDYCEFYPPETDVRIVIKFDNH